ncbi:MAG TPA: glycolate oxidase subunit GlcE [Ideonella sp.]|nr:glycolate oxidase subunit GlcE [Ideonella sp.]
MNEPALQAVVGAVREAADRCRPLRIVGGGTKDFYGGGDAATRRDEVLDVKPLAGISAYEPTELVVTVRAGTPLTELEAALAEQGQCLPFEPPHYEDRRPQADALHRLPPEGVGPSGKAASARGSTVGGMVAAGLAGPARATVGGVRDYLLGATIVNGQGELLTFGGQVMKNVAGYDVARVMAGSMGTLGVICEVSLKVLPQAPAQQSLRFDMDQGNALRHVNEWIAQALPIHASAWWDGALIVRLAGARAAVATAAQRLGSQGGEPVDKILAVSFWAGLRDQRDEFFAQAGEAVAGGARLWRLSVAATAPKILLPGEQLVEWHGAQRWLVTDLSPAAVRDAAADAMGHATVWRGDKSEGAFAPLSPVQARLQRALKAAFDPLALFNPGRLDNLDTC